MKKFMLICSLMAIFISGYSQCNIAIRSGDRHSILLKDNGTIQTWGNGISGFGALGNGSNLNVLAPTQIGFFSDYAKIFAGSYTTFAIKTDGTLWATGNNEEGQLGNGTSGPGNVSNVFFQIGTDTNWSTLSASSAHTLGIKTDGTLWAWGSNQQGKLGDGTFTNRLTPVQIGTATNWKAIASGLQFSAGIQTDGTLWAWGLNNAVANRIYPTQIGVDNDWRSISVSPAGIHTLVLKNNGALYVFGRTWSGGIGALGLGPEIFAANFPTRIGMDTDWLSISAGFNNSFGIKTNGTLWAWGQNNLGQLGDGTQVDKTTPVQIGTQTDWAAVSAGQRHTVALKTNGDLYTWGDNSQAQLGSGNYSSVIAPLFVNSCMLSIDEFEADAFVLYPNPCQNRIVVSSKILLNEPSVEIIDITGKKVLKVQTAPNINGEYVIDVEGLASGFYTVVVSDHHQIKGIKKIIKE